MKYRRQAARPRAGEGARHDPGPYSERNQTRGRRRREGRTRGRPEYFAVDEEGSDGEGGAEPHEPGAAPEPDGAVAGAEGAHRLEPRVVPGNAPLEDGADRELPDNGEQKGSPQGPGRDAAHQAPPPRAVQSNIDERASSGVDGDPSAPWTHPRMPSGAE